MCRVTRFLALMLLGLVLFGGLRAQDAGGGTPTIATATLAELNELKTLCTEAQPFVLEAYAPELTTKIAAIDARIAALTAVEAFATAVAGAVDAVALKAVLDANVAKVADLKDKGGVEAKVTGFVTAANVPAAVDAIALKALSDLHASAQPFVTKSFDAEKKIIDDRIAALAVATKFIGTDLVAATADSLMKLLTDNKDNAAVLSVEDKAKIGAKAKEMLADMTTIAALDALVAATVPFVADFAADVVVVEVKSILIFMDAVAATTDGDMASLKTAFTGKDLTALAATFGKYKGKAGDIAARTVVTNKIKLVLANPKFGL